MGNKRMLLVGGGGHCRSVLDCLRRIGTYETFGIIDQEGTLHSSRFGVPITGSDADLPELFAGGWTSAVIALGSIGNPERRQALFERLKIIGFSLPPVVDPSALIGYEAIVKEGAFIGKGTVVNVGAQIGCCAIINTGAVVEHDCTIGNFVHVSPGCTLCGGVAVGENTHVGAGSVVRQQVQIGRNCLIGAGSVVVSSIPDGAEAYGNPCKVVKYL